PFALFSSTIRLPPTSTLFPYTTLFRSYTGMRLAGVHGVGTHERDDLRDALEKVLADKTVGIVLLTEKFGREFPDIIDTFRLERKMPLLVEIPDRHGTGRKKDFITSYITEAIGLKL